MKSPSHSTSHRSNSSPSALQPGWPDQRDPDDRYAIRHREDQLDNALEESFPASDPIACFRCN